MRILVTGASGFIGRHVIARLNPRDEVLMLSRRARANPIKAKSRWLMGDISGLPRLKRKIKAFDPQVCIHLAWAGIPDFSFARSKKNLDDSIRFLDFIIQETSCRKIVASGTCFEYGRASGRCRESDMTRTTSYLGWAKKALHDYLECACMRKAVDLVWFRMFYVYGPGQRVKSLIPSAFRALREGRTPEVNHPDSANDYVHVRDVADAVAKAARPGTQAGVFNLGSGRATRAGDVCRMVERACAGKTRLTQRLRRRGRVASINLRADTRKSRRLLGWSARIGLQEGILDYVGGKGMAA